ncbi:hypothetical protein F5Y03DRAFT_391765 [Xylaria venustula]|nr:hypothetical protein F5Y03DRAFT_391765 [Xylaria venustula]
MAACSHQEFVQGLWDYIRPYLDGHTDIVAISAHHFNLLGGYGESFIKYQASIILNDVAEFFFDSTRYDRIYLANPTSVIRSMIFTITTVGGRLRALTPILTAQANQNHGAFYSGVHPELIDPRLIAAAPAVQQLPMIPGAMYYNSTQNPNYYAQAWGPMPSFPIQTAAPFNYGTQAVSPHETMSPTPIRQSYNDPLALSMQSGLPMQSTAAIQHTAPEPTRQHQHSESSPAEDNEPDESPARNVANPPPAPIQESEEGNEPTISRPPNAFILFRSAHSQQLRKAQPGIHNNDISSSASARWRGMSAQEKQHWVDEQHRLAVEHKRLYPNWRYQPKKKRTRVQKNNSRRAPRRAPRRASRST